MFIVLVGFLPLFGSEDENLFPVMKSGDFGPEVWNRYSEESGLAELDNEDVFRVEWNIFPLVEEEKVEIDLCISNVSGRDCFVFLQLEKSIHLQSIESTGLWMTPIPPKPILENYYPLKWLKGSKASETPPPATMLNSLEVRTARSVPKRVLEMERLKCSVFVSGFYRDDGSAFLFIFNDEVRFSGSKNGKNGSDAKSED